MRIYHIVKEHYVFNVEQCEGLDKLRLPELPQPEDGSNESVFITNTLAEKVIEHSEAKIIYKHQDKAFYAPSHDVIILPERAQFPSSDGFYSTILHELVHSTGHSSRLNRTGIVKSKSDGKTRDECAFEELIAELGSAYLNAVCNVPGRCMHEEYINDWIKQLKNDNSAIFKASGFAREATNYLLNKVPDFDESILIMADQALNLIITIPVGELIQLDSSLCIFGELFIMESNLHRKNFSNIFNSLTRHRNSYEVFRDFVSMTAFSLHNAIAFDKVLEQEYMDIIKNMNLQK